MAEDQKTPQDYRDTVFLPRTDFPMRGGLPAKEPELLARWRAMDLYGQLRTARADAPRFVLHDGPPYANGNIHIGHALNKILKDVVMRSRSMLGMDVPYVPGWDCHGLPIEWKIEEQYRAKGKDKDGVPVLDFRAECRAFAARWRDIQSEEFQRLGVLGDWGHPYTTMTAAAEAQIAREIHAFAANGLLYKGVRPVMWSVVEKTALAEAEIEYEDHVSTTIWVKFPIVKTPVKELEGASVVIWTTTPWTIPGNRAVAFGDCAYVVLDTARYGRVAVAADLAASFTRTIGEDDARTVATVPGEHLAGTVCAHPWRGRAGYDGYFDYDVPLYHGDFVTTETGTGFVHIAPGHGEDDFRLGQKHAIAFDETVGPDGVYLPRVKGFAGRSVYKPNGKEGDANAAVLAALTEAGALLAQGKITHSYPHSWRSKAPLIFRTTPQWFIHLDRPAKGQSKTLRQLAMDAIGATRWVPGTGENRIRGMIENRPDWCISRQRSWGVPIAIFVHKETGDVLRDESVFRRIADAFEKDGADAWYTRNAQEFLGNAYKASDYDQVFDIVDVWFESGSTHAFVLNNPNSKASEWPELGWPADLYLEGSDQHRGWFHSSLLEGCGTMGRAPFKAVLTHGFTLDEQGRKMSKSLGNVVAPQKVMDEMGADILRLWVVASDTTQDLRIGKDILKQMGDLYRRLRNTLRYLLGALDGMSAAERVEMAAMPELERWILHRLAALDAVVRADIEAYDFNHMIQELHVFCANDLSAFYFDIRKDSLYCDPADSPRRRAARTVMELVFDRLVLWLAPILCFTAEEAWLARQADTRGSVHLLTYADTPAAWRDERLAATWSVIRDVRRVVTGAMEIARANKTIGSSLQASPEVFVTAEQGAALDGHDLAEICICSGVTVTVGAPPAEAFALAEIPGTGALVRIAGGTKCERCWQVLPEVGQHADHPGLCHRCHDAVTGGHAHAA